MLALFLSSIMKLKVERMILAFQLQLNSMKSWKLKTSRVDLVLSYVGGKVKNGILRVSFTYIFQISLLQQHLISREKPPFGLSLMQVIKR